MQNILSNLEKGTKLYSYSDTIGMQEIEFIGPSNKGYIVLIDGNEKYVRPALLKPFRETQDDATIAFYKSKLNEINKVVDNRQKKLDETISKKKKLINDFYYLKEKYPEEFI
jgi:tRNA(Phe) wybutosine-synthesizing methylase Tyw3